MAFFLQFLKPLFGFFKTKLIFICLTIHTVFILIFTLSFDWSHALLTVTATIATGNRMNPSSRHLPMVATVLTTKRNKLDTMHFSGHNGGIIYHQHIWGVYNTLSDFQ